MPAGGLASALEAAAEAASGDPVMHQDACALAATVWERFGLSLLNTDAAPRERFVHLIHQLGHRPLALSVALRLKVVLLL